VPSQGRNVGRKTGPMNKRKGWGGIGKKVTLESPVTISARLGSDERRRVGGGEQTSTRHPGGLKTCYGLDVRKTPTSE